jgi:hypothetical protein
VAVAQSVYFACGLKATEFFFVEQTHTRDDEQVKSNINNNSEDSSFLERAEF